MSDKGWWYYFPIALGVKTPIPYLLLAIAGIVLLMKRRHRDALREERRVHEPRDHLGQKGRRPPCPVIWRVMRILGHQTRGP